MRFKVAIAEAAELEFTGYLRKTISIRDTFVQKKMKEKSRNME